MFEVVAADDDGNDVVKGVIINGGDDDDDGVGADKVADAPPPARLLSRGADDGCVWKCDVFGGGVGEEMTGVPTRTGDFNFDTKGTRSKGVEGVKVAIGRGGDADDDG